MASERLSALERLPDEILLLIVDGLDDVSAICLKNTNSNLKGKINRDPESFNRCTKWLIECRLESDLFKTIPIEQRPDKVTRYTCSMCKTKRSMDQIHGRGSGRKGVPFSIYDTGRLLCLNSTTRYCAKHPFFITWVKPTPGVPVSSRWTATPRRTCTHCAARVESSDSRANGCAKCQCDVCPPAKIRAHFTRYGALPKAARGGRPFIDGVLWWSGGKVLVSEVGKFFPVKGERRPYLTDDDVLSLSAPEYNGNLSDISPWEWRDRKRVKVYKAIKSFIEDHIIAQRC